MPKRNLSSLVDLLNLNETIQVADIGASAITETPVYKELIAKGLGHLFAFDGDERHIAKLQNLYGTNATILNGFLADGGFWRMIEGNTITHTGTVTMTDASTREIVPGREARSRETAQRVRQLLLKNFFIYGVDGAAIVHAVANDNSRLCERFLLRDQIAA